MTQDKKIFYQLDCMEADTEKLVHWRENVEKLIANYQEELWGINTELLGRLEANSGAIYGSDHILEAKEGRATFSPWMFRPFMEIFLTSELDDCYARPPRGHVSHATGRGKSTSTSIGKPAPLGSTPRSTNGWTYMKPPGLRGLPPSR